MGGKLFAIAHDIQTKMKVLIVVATQLNANWDSTLFEVAKFESTNDLLVSCNFAFKLCFRSV